MVAPCLRSSLASDPETPNDLYDRAPAREARRVPNGDRRWMLRSNVGLGRTSYLEGLRLDSAAEISKQSAAIPATVRTICHCHHWSLSSIQFAGGAWGVHVMTMLLMG